jgi:hypothetical protein
VIDEQPDFGPPPASGSIFLRMAWMGVVPAILVCIFVLANTEPWTFTGYDFAVVLLLVGGIVARAVDVLRYGGTTAYGEPSTPRHIVRYAIGLMLVTTTAWLLAQSIGL